ncbi:unnamed protein product [Lactuca saligna]|uniref:Uncharacterized protein n=1 Tax=Lactuca saligna TaxID=75948 RepID=A0AA36A1P9_LACSI|nr:unnamed protein product [Lactuca saligna]
MEAVIENLQSIARKPPQAVLVTTESPSGSDKDDSNASLLPRKLRPNDETFALGRSSAPPPTEHDAASVKLAKLLAFQDSIPQSKGKGIYIFSGHGVRVLELEKENYQKNKQISYLQANLGGLTTLDYDLKYKLIGKFGNAFKTASFDGGKVPESFERVTAPNANIDQILSYGSITTEERKENKKRVDKFKKDKMLLMKSFDPNAHGYHPQMFIKEVGKIKFVDRYDDCSRIRMWGFEVEKKMWVVIRKSRNIEYCEKKIEFVSWTKVDLAELVHTPFHNSTNDPNAWAFKKFLEDKAKMNFEGMTTTSSFIKKANDVIDPHTNKNVGFSENGEHDIHTLSKHQLMVENEMFEATTKDFTSMIATIIDKKLWAGALADSDMHIVEKP